MSRIRSVVAVLAILGAAAVPAATSPVSAAVRSSTHSQPRSSDPQVWLCSPTIASSKNPCLASETATSVNAKGARSVLSSSAAKAPKIDCFYVYPTVSTETTLNSNLVIQSSETDVAIEQASRFASVCRVFAPMYPQVTIPGLFSGRGDLSGTGTSKGQSVAYAGVLAAWKDYLSRYNAGRGVVLIGHSQGSFLLRELISKVIDPNATERKLLVSAILPGGNVQVPVGKVVGGDFHHVPACTSDTEVGCVIAYSSFLTTPPSTTLFGRPETAGDQVLCTNPAALAGGSGTLSPFFTTNVPGDSDMAGAVSSTPWVTYPKLLSATCKSSGGTTWLQVTETRASGDHRPTLMDTQSASWGLHQKDINLTLGNLISIVSSETTAYLAR